MKIPRTALTKAARIILLVPSLLIAWVFIGFIGLASPTIRLSAYPKIVGRQGGWSEVFLKNFPDLATPGVRLVRFRHASHFPGAGEQMAARFEVADAAFMHGLRASRDGPEVRTPSDVISVLMGDRAWAFVEGRMSSWGGDLKGRREDFDFYYGPGRPNSGGGNHGSESGVFLEKNGKTAIFWGWRW